LLPVKVTGSARVHAFATVGEDGVTRVLVLALSATAPDHLRLSLAANSATLLRLRGAGLDATSGLTLGGQTWDGSADGKPPRAAASETLQRNGDGWIVPIAGYEAVLISAE